MPIRLKRVYDPTEPSDGVRILVDRLWPRGLSRDKAHLDHWMRDVAPSTALRQWFGHDPSRWAAFRRLYFAELDAASEAVQTLRQVIGRRRATLLYAAKDLAHNHAIVLRDYLDGYS